MLADTVTEEQANSMLWRRETGQVNSSKKYVRPAPGKKDAVTVDQLKNFEGMGTVLYTKIPSNTGILYTAG